MHFTVELDYVHLLTVKKSSVHTILNGSVQSLDWNGGINGLVDWTDESANYGKKE